MKLLVELHHVCILEEHLCLLQCLTRLSLYSHPPLCAHFVSFCAHKAPSYYLTQRGIV